MERIIYDWTFFFSLFIFTIFYRKFILRTSNETSTKKEDKRQQCARAWSRLFMHCYFYMFCCLETTSHLKCFRLDSKFCVYFASTLKIDFVTSIDCTNYRIYCYGLQNVTIDIPIHLFRRFLCQTKQLQFIFLNKTNISITVFLLSWVELGWAEHYYVMIAKCLFIKSLSFSHSFRFTQSLPVVVGIFKCAIQSI